LSQLKFIFDLTAETIFYSVIHDKQTLSCSRPHVHITMSPTSSSPYRSNTSKRRRSFDSVALSSVHMYSWDDRDSESLQNNNVINQKSIQSSTRVSKSHNP